MVSSEVSTSVFVDSSAGEAPHIVTLTEMGESVTTVTATTRIARDPKGTAYYIKEASDEHRQLSLLRVSGIPVPSGIFLHARDNEFATRSAGTPLHERLASNPDEAPQRMHAVGRTLRAIHDTLNTIVVPEEALATTYTNTSHIVDCFFYKYYGIASGATLDSYRQHKADIASATVGRPDEISVEMPLPFIAPSESFSPALRELVDTANMAATHYMQITHAIYRISRR